MGQTLVVSVYTVGDELVKYMLALTFLSLSTDPFLRQERSLKADNVGSFRCTQVKGSWFTSKGAGILPYTDGFSARIAIVLVSSTVPMSAYSTLLNWHCRGCGHWTLVPGPLSCLPAHIHLPHSPSHRPRRCPRAMPSSITSPPSLSKSHPHSCCHRHCRQSLSLLLSHFGSIYCYPMRSCPILNPSQDPGLLVSPNLCTRERLMPMCMWRLWDGSVWVLGLYQANGGQRWLRPSSWSMVVARSRRFEVVHGTACHASSIPSPTSSSCPHPSVKDAC